MDNTLKKIRRQNKTIAVSCIAFIALLLAGFLFYAKKHAPDHAVFQIVEERLRGSPELNAEVGGIQSLELIGWEINYGSPNRGVDGRLVYRISGSIKNATKELNFSEKNGQISSTPPKDYKLATLTDIFNDIKSLFREPSGSHRAPAWQSAK